MRYLKKFNEEESFESDLSEFCDNYLSYLKDKGFDIKIEYLRYKSIAKHFKIKISKPIEKSETTTRYGSFNYSDVKDDFVPFIKMLDSNYEISNSEIEFSGGGRYIIKIDDLEKADGLNHIIDISIIVQTMSHRK